VINNVSSSGPQDVVTISISDTTTINHKVHAQGNINSSLTETGDIPNSELAIETFYSPQISFLQNLNATSAPRCASNNTAVCLGPTLPGWIKSSTPSPTSAACIIAPGMTGQHTRLMDTTFATNNAALSSETRWRCSGSRWVNIDLERDRSDWGIWVFGGRVRRAFGGGGVGGPLDGGAKVGDGGDDNGSELSEWAG
jgi:hypothetical protein